jgi:serine protease inhibitor
MIENWSIISILTTIDYNFSKSIISNFFGNSLSESVLYLECNVYVFQTFVKTVNYHFESVKLTYNVDSSRSWWLAQGKPVRLQNFVTTQELNKKVVLKYFGFIKAKDGSATKTNLDI